MSTFVKFRRIYQDLLVSCLVILFVVIGYFGGIYPASQKVLQIIEQKKQLTQERNALSEKLDILDSLDEAALRNDLSTVIAAVPADKSVPTLFQTIEGLASITGVALNSVNVAGVGQLSTQSAIGTSALEKQIGSHLLPFVASLQGSFENIQQFITQVPQVRRLVRIRTFTMSFPEDETPLQISFEMDAFYEPFPTSLGKQSTPIAALGPKEVQVIATLSEFPIIGQTAGVTVAPSAQLKQNPFSP